MGEYLENRKVGLRPSKAYTCGLFSLEKQTYIALINHYRRMGLHFPHENLQLLANTRSTKAWYYKCDITNIDTT
ncbi:hypothetical protein N7445_007696 [Penicillium cf. griseofulvum]|nr:hypothetical protein N7445_007696 [Penicillium cf. griseofulvum]